MRKDIIIPEVKDVYICVVKEGEELGNPDWYVYLVNNQEVDIDTILITSSGYGTVDDEERKSSTLRYLIKKLPAKSFSKIEPILEDLFILNNEYWLSFYIGNQIYDQIFLFEPGCIREDNFTIIPLIEKVGVLAK